jgi:rhodanese-related sulfurtransferase
MLRQELFRRMDESPDALFYEAPRLVTHIDDAAIAAVTQLYREHFPAGGAILDLMSSWVSHLPEEIAYRRVVGLGMNAAELAANSRLHARVVQDLNQDPHLPFADGEFDAGGICVSVDYLIHPVEVLRECGRVIIPGGPLVITFSNRCFPTKAIAAWQMLDDEGHQRLVEQFFEAAATGRRSPASTGARRWAMTRCTRWWPEAPAPYPRSRKDHAHDLAGRARSPDEERHAPRRARPPRARRLSEAPHLSGDEPAAAAPRAAPAAPRAGAATPIVLCDDTSALSALAVPTLRAMGYSNAVPLAGGLDAWVADGRSTVQGVNTPSKVFGERVLHDLHTPEVTCLELDRRMAAGEDMVIVDTRTPEEYARGCLPGAWSMPGGELVLRLGELVKRPDTTIVVHCGGRTRSYLGAESVRKMGLPNPVVAVKNGTMGWVLDGLELERGASRWPPEPSPGGRALAAKVAKRVAADEGVPFVSPDEVKALLARRDRRTSTSSTCARARSTRPRTSPAPSGRRAVRPCRRRTNTSPSTRPRSSSRATASRAP